MDKVKIGENEYTPPFRELDDEEINEVWVMDAGNNYVKVESVIAALNELAQLRAERDGLVKRVEELGLTLKKYKGDHQGCHVMEFAPCSACDFIASVERCINDINNPTTPGGDDGCMVGEAK